MSRESRSRRGRGSVSDTSDTCLNRWCDRCLTRLTPRHTDTLVTPQGRLAAATCVQFFTRVVDRGSEKLPRFCPCRAETGLFLKRHAEISVC